jgi:hypothetical protein
MTAREVKLGDRVTIGKGRTRYTVVAIVRGALSVERLGPELISTHSVAAAILARHGGRYWRGKARGKGRAVALDRLVRVKR